MSNSKNTNNLEQEIAKQIQQIDRRLDRSGWFYLVGVLVIFFLLVYLTVTIFSIPTGEEASTEQAVTEERIQNLESRVLELESLLEDFE
ncbi:hypothetical protein GIY11_08445 [Aerococcaceae bacterium DSM 109653]|uniref:Uncharacterized protein n=1 Tax=Fundicoccus ignavus TaxID=2664442 RepID=A0A6I2GD95_9LACT|nr:hypothetical protein [Fundicoccus ignavus]MRI82031.1 hypothetical protein [Fundicoccus ignavus]MRI85770.1 hypothetical protein [Fundicoccus ignavus]